ncbi:MAG: stage II sporulation protein D [Peptococcaceae bacterium]
MRRLAGFVFLIFLFGLSLIYLKKCGFLIPGQKEFLQVRLYQHKIGEIVSLPLEEYINGVVAAEMPAEFPEEALKAQAVAARTYVLKRIKAGGLANNIHPGADICDDHRHGQAWISPPEMQNRWGLINYYRYHQKIKRAVNDTRGIVLAYQGQLIDPVYHSSCGGRGTENSAEVWRDEIPYLKGVSCPYCADPVPVQTVNLKTSELNYLFEATSIVAINKKDKQPQHIPAKESIGLKKEKNLPSFAVLTFTTSGRPKLVCLNDQVILATTLRDLLGLRSTDFTWETVGNQVKINTRGYGHAVGMCQYGAKGMALRGWTFAQILTHYYTGVELIKL